MSTDFNNKKCLISLTNSQIYIYIDIHILNMTNNRNRLSHTRLPVRAPADDTNEWPAQTAYVARVGYTHLYTTVPVRHEPYPTVRTYSRQWSSTGSVYGSNIIEVNNCPNGESLSSATTSYFNTSSGYYDDTITTHYPTTAKHLKLELHHSECFHIPSSPNCIS